MPRLTPVLTLAAVALAGCGGGGSTTDGAAQSASRLLGAALKGDRVAFEAEIDRAAVRDDVRRQVSQMAKGSALDVDGGPSEFALDRMIGPQAVRVVQAGTGAAVTRPPSPAQVAPLLTRVDRGHVCLKGKASDCALMFAKARGGWRLVGMTAMGLQVEVAGD
jgi:hypothetical protein